MGTYFIFTLQDSTGHRAQSQPQHDASIKLHKARQEQELEDIIMQMLFRNIWGNQGRESRVKMEPKELTFGDGGTH